MTNRLLLSLMLVVATGDLPETPADANGARIFRDDRAGTLVLDLAPTDLPANTSHHNLAQPPVATLEIPETGFIYGFRVQVVDSVGHELPDELIHHFNLIDPDHRELFLPISRRLLAAGHETGAIRLPRLLFGLPLKRGSTSSRAPWSRTSRRSKRHRPQSLPCRHPGWANASAVPGRSPSGSGKTRRAPESRSPRPGGTQLPPPAGSGWRPRSGVRARRAPGHGRPPTRHRDQPRPPAALAAM